MQSNIRRQVFATYLNQPLEIMKWLDLDCSFAWKELQNSQRISWLFIRVSIIFGTSHVKVLG